MRAQVLLTHRAGVPLSERDMMAAKPLRGQLQTFYRTSKGGNVLVAVLRVPDSQVAEPLARLSRVELSQLGDDGLRLRGLERVGRAWVAQGWLCRLEPR